MKTKSLILAVVAIAFLAVTLSGQVSTSPKWLYGYVGSQGKWFTMGPTLAVSSSGQIDAVVTQGPAGPQGPQGIAGPMGPQGPAGMPAPRRVRDVVLVYDGVGGWLLPAGASNVSVLVNGIRYRSGKHYTVTGGKVVPIAAAILPDFEVTVDYDQ